MDTASGTVKQDILANKYYRLESRFAREILERLPDYTFSNLQSLLRSYAFEAAELYNPTKGVCSVFVYKHLLTRSVRFVNEIEISNGKYSGYEGKAASKLFKRVPGGLTSFDDLLCEARLWSIEATRLFDPFRGVSFSTFLYKHLYVMSLTYSRDSWRKKTCPAGGRVTPISFLKFNAKDHDATTPHTREVSKEDMISSTNCVNSSHSMQLKELMDNLSLISKTTLKTILTKGDASLIQDIRMRRAKKVSEVTEIPIKMVKGLIEEVTAKAPRYVDYVS